MCESEYNTECITGRDLSKFRVVNNEFLNKNLYVVPEQASLIILDSKPAVCMANGGKYTKHTRNIPRIMNFVTNN